MTLHQRARIESYVEPYFYQNWQLFAPAPLVQERGILLRAEVIDEDGDRQVTEFEDITSRYVDSIHKTRLFPPRVARVIPSLFQLLTYEDPILSRFIEAVASQGEDIELGVHLDNANPFGLGKDFQEQNPTSYAIIQSFARLEAESAWGPNVSRVQLRFVYAAPTPFSQRAEVDRDADIQVWDSEWLSVR